MKQFPQGIFQSIDWLIKQVDRLKFQISRSGGSGSSVSTDSITVQGDGTVTNPIKSYETVSYYGNPGVTITLSESSTIHYVYDTGEIGVSSCSIAAPLPTVEGKKITIINVSGYTASLSNFQDPVQTLGNNKTGVFICIKPCTGINTDPALVWFLLDIF